MDKNILILSLVIIMIIIILIFYMYFNNDKKKNTSGENFMDNIPEFVKNYENINFKAPPNYKNQNITQYNFDRLFEQVAMINKNKINLKEKSNYNFYTQSTT